MKRAITVAVVAIASLLPPALAPAQTPAAPPPCTGHGVKLSFICDVNNPEDLVQVPGVDWIIASNFANAQRPGSGGLTLIDPASRKATRVAIGAGKAAAPFDRCPGPLDFSKFSAHGLNIRSLSIGKARLLVVGHGGREAIEVFDVASGKGAPTMTWAGCIPSPAGANMNSVTQLSDGRVIVSDFVHAPLTMGDALQGKNTGAVYAWKPGGAFEKLPGTDLPGPNGIEVTPDRKYLFLAVTGASSVLRFELADTAKPPQAIKTDFRTDNLRWGPGGKLLLAGPGTDPNCKPGPGVRCFGTAVVGALDPGTMKLTEVIRTPPEPGFQGTSSGLIVGKTVWLGSYMADRVAYAGL